MVFCPNVLPKYIVKSNVWTKCLRRLLEYLPFLKTLRHKANAVAEVKKRTPVERVGFARSFAFDLSHSQNRRTIARVYSLAPQART